MTLRTTQTSPGSRRRLLASTEGVLVLLETLRPIGKSRSPAWVIVGCHFLPPCEVPICAFDVQEAFRATNPAAA